MSEIGEHYHLDDYPAMLRLLSQLLGHRSDRDDDRQGYRPTEHGAFVDWDRLTTGHLSSTLTGPRYSRPRPPGQNRAMGDSGLD